MDRYINPVKASIRALEEGLQVVTDKLAPIEELGAIKESIRAVENRLEAGLRDLQKGQGKIQRVSAIVSTLCSKTVPFCIDIYSSYIISNVAWGQLPSIS